MLSSTDSIVLRPPTLDDGFAVNQLIKDCPPLDTNSGYCNFLQCSHFSATSVAALANDSLVGFISGYLIPDRPDTLFIWQVAVSEKARGVGLASRMLGNILNREQCRHVDFLETTITPGNKASWALFQGFADKNATECIANAWLDKYRHFKGQHDSEELVRIGPFRRSDGHLQLKQRAG